MHVKGKTVAATASEPLAADTHGKGQDTGPVKLSEQTKGRLGLHLRAMYGELVAQPVPDRFKDLIAKLDDPALGETNGVGPARC